MRRWIILFSLGLLAAILAYRGFATAYPPPEPVTLSSQAITIINNAYRALRAALGVSNPSEAPLDWNLALSRVLSTIVALWAAFEVVAFFLADRLTRLRARGLKGHTILLGDGTHARLFEAERVAARARTVAVTREDRPRPPRGRRRALAFKVPTVDGASLIDAGVGGAAALILAGDDDSENQEILALVRTLVPKRAVPLTVTVRIDNSLLVRQLEREETFTAGPGIDVIPFNPARIAARRFLAREPLVDQAHLRVQERVHLVAVGYSPFVFEVLEQLARLAPYRDFARPRVDLLVRDADRTADALAALQPALGTVLDMTFHEASPETGLPRDATFAEIEPGEATVTGVLVSLGDDAATAAGALTLRERTVCAGRWRAPIYAHLAAETSLNRFIAHRAAAADPQDRIAAVGALSDSCSLEAVTGAREALARRVHEGYLARRGIAEGVPVALRAPNDRPWSALAPSYRIASRRAADHLAIKLLGMDLVPAPEGFEPTSSAPFAPEGEALEALARLEHQSWMIDRLLDGWRPGPVRDNRARIHDSLVPYDALSDTLKDFDRDQVRVLTHVLSSAARPHALLQDVTWGLVPPDLSGLAGEPAVPGMDMPSAEALATLRGLRITLAVPLVPGWALDMADTLLARLAALRLPHRLVLLRGTPEFAAETPGVAEQCARLMAAATFLVDLTVPGLDLGAYRDPARRAEGSTRLAQWLGRRADRLIRAPLRPGLEPQPARFPGAAGSLLEARH